MAHTFFKHNGSINGPCLESEGSNQIEATNSTHEYKFILNHKNTKRKPRTKEKFNVRKSKFGVDQKIEEKTSDWKKKYKVNTTTLHLKSKREILNVTKKECVHLKFFQNSHNSVEIEENMAFSKNMKEEDFDESSYDDNQSSNLFLSTNMFKRVGSLSKPLFECQLCFKQIKESSRKQHSITHAGLKPFSCCYCESRFTRKGDAIRHRRTVHGNLKMLNCSICNKKFSDPKHLSFHLQNHDKMFSYVCAKCGFKFGKKEYFESHIRYIHPSPKDQNIIDLKEVISGGEKPVEELELKTSKTTDIYLPGNFDKEAKEENDDKYLYSFDSNVKTVSGDSSCPCKFSSFDDKDTNDPVCKDQAYLIKSEMASSKIESQASSAEHCKKDEDLVNLAIKSAISQAKCTLEKLSTKNNFNITLNKNISTKSVKSKITKKLAKNEFGCPEIHITANFDGVLRKFIIYVPFKNLNPQCKEGLNFISNIVSHTCCGKGEINGPIEIEIRQT